MEVAEAPAGTTRDQGSWSRTTRLCPRTAGSTSGSTSTRTPRPGTTRATRRSFATRPTGAMELYTWNGTQYVAGSNAGVAAAFTAGMLTVSIPRASINATGAFGVLVVGSRGQPVADEELVASDFVPNAGRARFAGPDAATFPDVTGDHDAAPDLTAVRVSDARNGWITFSMTTPELRRATGRVRDRGLDRRGQRSSNRGVRNGPPILARRRRSWARALGRRAIRARRPAHARPPPQHRQRRRARSPRERARQLLAASASRC